MNYISVSKFESKIAPGVVYMLRKLSHGRRTKIRVEAAAPLSKISEIQRRLVPIMEEIDRAEELAKSEPCTCKHELSLDLPEIQDSVRRIESMNKMLSEKGGTPITLVEVCHSSLNKCCIFPGCPCRRPRPDPAIGGYQEHHDLLSQITEIEYQEVVPFYIRGLVAEIQGLEIDGKPATVDTLLSDAHDSLTRELNTEIQRLISLTPDEALGFKSPTTSGAVVDGPPATMGQPTAPPANPESTTSSATAAGSSQAR